MKCVFDEGEFTPAGYFSLFVSYIMNGVHYDNFDNRLSGKMKIVKIYNKDNVL